MPIDAAVSDDEDIEDEDDDVADPDYDQNNPDGDIPGPCGEETSKKRKNVKPVMEEVPVEDEEDEAKYQPPQKKKKTADRLTSWAEIDLDNPALPAYVHSPPLYIESPFQYFSRFFSPQLIQHITDQTNLYATQKDISNSFCTTDEEIMHFLAILIYMGNSEMASVWDYLSMETKVPQVAELMSSRRFMLLKRLVHFNDNSQVHGNIDRFFKVRPLFTFLNEAFRTVPQTPKQSVDEVMISYEENKAGNLRQYSNTEPDKIGFKLFARASEDGFIHDIMLYQGKTTLQTHRIPLNIEQEAMDINSQIVSVLASTMSSNDTTVIFADNFFTSMQLVRYLKSKNCRYTGTARDNRMGKPPLKPIENMEKKDVPRGTWDYVTSDEGILALRWKDSKVVTILSTDLGVNPVSSFSRYCTEIKKLEEVQCPAVVKSYNANIGGIDKSDMLVHLHHTPMKSKRWYLRLFAYAIDISLINAWIIYRRDCKALQAEDGLPLKQFRIQVFKTASCQKLVTSRHQKHTTLPSLNTAVNKAKPINTSVNLPKPVRGHRSHVPDSCVRFDYSLFHCPVYTTRQTCKFCSKKDNILRSNVVCSVCKVHLCLNEKRNCFMKYHQPVA